MTIEHDGVIRNDGRRETSDSSIIYLPFSPEHWISPQKSILSVYKKPSESPSTERTLYQSLFETNLNLLSNPEVFKMVLDVGTQYLITKYEKPVEILNTILVTKAHNRIVESDLKIIIKKNLKKKLNDAKIRMAEAPNKKDHVGHFYYNKALARFHDDILASKVRDEIANDARERLDKKARELIDKSPISQRESKL